MDKVYQYEFGEDKIIVRAPDLDTAIYVAQDHIALNPDAYSSTDWTDIDQPDYWNEVETDLLFINLNKGNV